MGNHFAAFTSTSSAPSSTRCWRRSSAASSRRDSSSGSRSPSSRPGPRRSTRPWLVNFWTLTCINWLRQEPYIRAWSQAYRTDGLVVIGVHTPEFSFEHQLDRVRQATTERGID
jgi:hypothetical protein